MPQYLLQEILNRSFYVLWVFLEPLLFGLIGIEVDITSITSSLIGKGIAVILSGLVVRVILSMVVVSGNGFNFRDRVVIAASWIPKATVQVRICIQMNSTAVSVHLHA
jgi:Kef-type K+ transport system membrane component KefB